MYKLSRLFFVLAILGCGYAAAVLTTMFWPQSCLGVLVIAVFVAKLRRKVHLTTLGSARWAAHADLYRAGMVNAARGLSIGHLTGREPGRVLSAISSLFNKRIGDKEACQTLDAAFKKSDRGALVRLTKAIHTVVFSPSGGGKGVSFVIPFLLSCPDSCVVIDLKGENARLTAEHRRKVFGHRIVLLDPFNEITQTPDSLNPLDTIEKDNPLAIDEANDLAQALVVRSPDERERHWSDSAEMWIAALIAMVVFYGNAEERSRSLQTVRDITSSPEKLEMAIKVMLESTEYDGMLARLGGQMKHYIDKEKSSVLTTVARHLKFLGTIAVAASTKASSFDPTELRKGKMTVYLILPPNHMRAQSALLRMWISALLRAVVGGGLQERNLTHFLLDEAASLGHLESLEDAIDKYRGYGVRLQFYFQSMGQLKKCFPDGGDQTLLSNTSQIFMGVNDQGLPGGAGTADYVSARLGEKTVIVDSGGTSSGESRQWSSSAGQKSGGGSTSWNGSENWQQQARKLLQPAEVVALPPRIAITFTPGVPPIRTWLPRYYEENRTKARPRLYRRTLDALNMLVFAVAAFATCIAIAVHVTQIALKQHPEWRNLTRPQWHFDTLNNDQSDVPVDPSFLRFRRIP